MTPASRLLSAPSHGIGIKSLQHKMGLLCTHSPSPLAMLLLWHAEQEHAATLLLLPAGRFSERPGPSSRSRRRRELLCSRHRHRQAGVHEPQRRRSRHKQHWQAPAGQLWRGRHAGLCGGADGVQGTAAGTRRLAAVICSVSVCFYMLEAAVRSL